MKEKNSKYPENTAGAEEYPLSQLYFYLTEGCNLACRHCWLAPKFDPDGSRHPILALDIFNKAVQEAIPLGLTSVKLTGGEPLLHPDFPAMLDILQKKKLALVLETNGLLCTRDIAKAIAGLDSPSVSISLDGADKETHDMIRGVDGAFEKATAAICELVANGIRPQVIMSVMQANSEQIETIIRLAEDLGASSVKFNIIQPTGRGEALHNAACGLDVKDLIALGRRVETEFVPRAGIKLYFDYPAAFRSLSRIAADGDSSACGILSILGVLPSGEYALCGIGSHLKELVFGKVVDDDLKKIWYDNQVLQDLRKGLPEKLAGICSHCLMKHICLGSCIAQNYYRTNSLWTPFWFCEQAEEAGLFPDSRIDLALKNS
jgi:SynChlorMet cassette radical SAM/SPASM protein ScmF